jgi:ABC-type transporter Mla MlaB component
MIVLPTHLSAPSALEVISVCQEVLAMSGVVDIEAGRLQYVDPMGMAMLGACLDASRKQGDSIRVHHLSPKLSGYLQRMDVFTGVELVDCTAITGARRDRSADLVELRQLCVHREVGEIAYRLANAIIGAPDANDMPDEMTGFTAHERLVEPWNTGIRGQF